MNAAKILEGAIAAVIYSCCRLEPMPRLRTWQAIDADGKWTSTDDRTFPSIDIRVSPPVVDENGCTFVHTAVIEIRTHAEVDQTHAEISVIYEAVQGAVDALYADYLTGVSRATISGETTAPGQARTAFLAEVAQQGVTSELLHVAGISYGTPMMPVNDDEANAIGVSIDLHCARKGFLT